LGGNSSREPRPDKPRRPAPRPRTCRRPAARPSRSRSDARCRAFDCGAKALCEYRSDGP
jgi:hypothetical protein